MNICGVLARLPRSITRLSPKQCMPKMISYLSQKYGDSKPHDQIVAIAASECGVSRKNDYGLDAGIRAALHLAHYKEKYSGLSLKENLKRAYYKIKTTNDFMESCPQDSFDIILSQLSQDFEIINDFTDLKKGQTITRGGRRFHVKLVRLKQKLKKEIEKEENIDSETEEELTEDYPVRGYWRIVNGNRQFVRKHTRAEGLTIKDKTRITSKKAKEAHEVSIKKKAQKVSEEKALMERVNPYLEGFNEYKKAIANATTVEEKEDLLDKFIISKNEFQNILLEAGDISEALFVYNNAMDEFISRTQADLKSLTEDKTKEINWEALDDIYLDYEKETKKRSDHNYSEHIERQEWNIDNSTKIIESLTKKLEYVNQGSSHWDSLKREIVDNERKIEKAEVEIERTNIILDLELPANFDLSENQKRSPFSYSSLFAKKKKEHREPYSFKLTGNTATSKKNIKWLERVKDEFYKVSPRHRNMKGNPISFLPKISDHPFMTSKGAGGSHIHSPGRMNETVIATSKAVRERYIGGGSVIAHELGHDVWHNITNSKERQGKFEKIYYSIAVDLVSKGFTSCYNAGELYAEAFMQYQTEQTWDEWHSKERKIEIPKRGPIRSIPIIDRTINPKGLLGEYPQLKKYFDKYVGK